LLSFDPFFSAASSILFRIQIGVAKFSR
jgi:hypothetical protein